jgi:hypothetical protein
MNQTHYHLFSISTGNYSTKCLVMPITTYPCKLLNLLGQWVVMTPYIYITVNTLNCVYTHFTTYFRIDIDFGRVIMN